MSDIKTSRPYRAPSSRAVNTKPAVTSNAGMQRPPSSDSGTRVAFLVMMGLLGLAMLALLLVPFML